MHENALIVVVIVNSIVWMIMLKMMYSYRKEAREMKSAFLYFSKKGTDYYHMVFKAVSEMCEMTTTNTIALKGAIEDWKEKNNAKVQVETDNN